MEHQKAALEVDWGPGERELGVIKGLGWFKDVSFVLNQELNGNVCLCDFFKGYWLEMRVKFDNY